MDYRASWSYTNFPAARQKHLGVDCPSYCEIIRQLEEVMKGTEIKFEIDVGYMIPVDGAKRPLFFVEGLEAGLVDWFFNGVSGYRAQYYKSPENGLKANTYAFAKLESILFKAASRASFSYKHPDHGPLTIDEQTFLTYLRLPSAKIWGEETEGLNQMFSGPGIDAPRWIENTKNGHGKAMKGTKAPQFTILKLHGAFLKNGLEVIPPDKTARSEDIYFFGFS